MHIPKINIADYDYNLPAERIAKYPLQNRDQSKLLLFNENLISEKQFTDLPSLLPGNALLVYNNTRVIRARLQFFKETGARIEVFCLEPFLPNDAAEAFLKTESVQWLCMVGNLKKWKEGKISASSKTALGDVMVYAKVIDKVNDAVIIEFEWCNNQMTFAEVMEGMGQTPIPPYLEREAEEIDTERYQTLYSKQKGSVAAPTAGLHFSDNVIAAIDKKGIKRLELTLHVGAGTFKPVKSDTIDGHQMHTENFEISIDSLNIIANHNGPVVAVGTTSVRTLESVYIAGIKLLNNENFNDINQWDGFCYKPTITRKQAFDAIVEKLKNQNLTHFKAKTTILIAPGYTFMVIDALITNFHQPRSTLLLLISALVGNNWSSIYDYALSNNFRFLSYGDSSLLAPKLLTR